jgi:hypothetical protein
MPGVTLVVISVLFRMNLIKIVFFMRINDKVSRKIEQFQDCAKINIQNYEH